MTLRDPLLLGKLLAETQAVTKLCSLGNRACLPDFKHGQVLGCVATSWGLVATPVSPVSSTAPTRRRVRIACPHPIGCGHHPQWKTVWISPTKSWIPCPIGLNSIGRRKSSSVLGHSKCESFRGYCLGPGQSAYPLPVGWAGITHNGRLFWSVPLSPGWLSLLLQRGWLDAPNLNLQ